MNLVKAQALANDLPISELKKYADGFDPRIIPPWIATGTLQAKMDLNKRMQNMMGGAQGDLPSVKEQIEQKAGLMAANTMQQRQQQAQQQMAMGSRPGPAPAGIPQPEDQPEAPVAAARGGLMSVPVQFAFKPGGIVGYSKGGEVDAAREEAKRAIANLRSYGTIKMRQDPEGFKAAEEAAAQARARLQAAEAAYAQEMGASGATRAATNIRDVGTVPELVQPEAPAVQRQAPVAPPMARPQPTEQTYVRSAGPNVPAPRQEATPRQNVPRPAPTAQAAQTGLPAAINTSPFLAQAAAALNEPNVKPTAESIIAEQKALSPEAMLEENMRRRYEERKARADQERAAFERTRPSGLDDLIRVFGQAAQYKGMSGLAPAYTANQQQKRAEELALEKRMNELYNAADVQEFEGAKELFGSRAKAMEAANRSYQERLKSRSETLAQLAGVDQRRMDEALNRLTQTEIAKIRAADAGGDMRYLAQYLALKADGKDKQADALLESYTRFKRGEPKPDPYKQELMKTIAEKEVALAAMPPSKLANETRAQLNELKRQAGITGGGGATPTTKAQYDALPKGATYIAPDGTTRVKG